MTGKRYRFSGDLLVNLGKNHKSQACGTWPFDHLSRDLKHGSSLG